MLLLGALFFFSLSKTCNCLQLMITSAQNDWLCICIHISTSTDKAINTVFVAMLGRTRVEFSDPDVTKVLAFYNKQEIV